MSVEDRVIIAAKRKQHEAACREIRKHLLSHIIVGEQLLIIRDACIYLETHNTLAAFLYDEFGLDRRRAWELMESAKVKANLCSNGTQDLLILPVCESQFLALAKVPPEKQVEVARKVSEKVAAENRKPTAKDYKKVVGELVLAAVEPEHEVAEDETEIAEDEDEIEEEPTIEEICESDNKAIESFCRAILKRFQDDVPKLPWTEDSGRIDSAVASLKAGLATLRGAKSQVCPACVEGRTEKGQCRYCKANGYLPVYQAKAIPAEMYL